MTKNKTHNKPPRFSFFAVSRTGNRGAVSMLESAIDYLTSESAQGIVDVFTVYPVQDKALGKPRPNVNQHNGTPANLVFKLIPLSLVYRFFSLFRVHLPHRVFGVDMAALLDSHVCVFAGGTTFSDDQIFKVIYNVVCILPAVILGKKTMLYSQTMGPFRNLFNRTCARWVFKRIDVIAPRGRSSFEYVRDIGITHSEELADSAFTLDVPDEVDQKIKDEYADLLMGKTVVGISINTIVERKCKQLGIDHNSEWIKFITWLQEKGFFVLLIPHSMRPGSTSPHNNDLVTVSRIYTALATKENVHVVEYHYDCKELRVLVGLADYCVVSRFHSMISAICTQTPVAVFGWGVQKYREVLADFDLEEYCSVAAKLSCEALIDSFERVVEDAELIRGNIRKYLPKVQTSSLKNHQKVMWLAKENDVLKTKFHGLRSKE